MANLEQTRVSTLVIEQPRRAQVFEHFGIDYCCGGRYSLAEACRRAGRQPQELLSALARLDAESPPPPREQPTLRALCDHIVATHHAYLYAEMPRLQQLLAKVRAAHGERHPELAELETIFTSLCRELEAHMAKEERVLFPMIRRMEGSASLDGLHCGSLRGPISVMELEHDDAGEALRRMRTLTLDYQAPADACTSFQLLYRSLQELERDLHEHIHKENNLLHPRAAALEVALGEFAGQEG